MIREVTNPITAALTGAAVFLSACSGGTPDAEGETPSAEPSDAVILDRTAQLALACSGCHGAGTEAIVDLSGYSQEQLETALTTYKAETEGSTVMHRFMRGYSDADIGAISAYLAREARP